MSKNNFPTYSVRPNPASREAGLMSPHAVWTLIDHYNRGVAVQTNVLNFTQQGNQYTWNAVADTGEFNVLKGQPVNFLGGTNISTVLAGDGGNDLTINVVDLHVADIAINNTGSATYVTAEDFINTNASNGLISGGLITDGGSGTIDVSSGSCMIRSTDSAVGVLYSANFSGTSGLALTDLVSNFIYINYNSGTPNITASTSPLSSIGSSILIGIVVRDGTATHVSQTSTHTTQFNQIASKRHALVDGVQRQSGSVTSETGARKLVVTSGLWWLAFDEYTITALDTSAAGTFVYYYQDGASGFTAVTSSTTIDNAQYDDTTGTLASLTGSRRGVHWLYLGVDDEYYVMYGLGNYTLNQAQDATPPTTLPPQLSNTHAGLIAKIIVGNGQTNLESIQNPYDFSFGTSVASSHLDLTDIGSNTHAQVDTHIADSTIHFTDHDDVTLAGESYLSLATQQITAAAVNLSGTHVTGNLPTTNLNSGTSASGTTFWRGDGTWASPAGGFANFDAGGDSGADQTVNSADLLDITGDTGITTTVSKASTTVTLLIDLDDTAVTPAAYTNADITIDQQGRITAAANGTVGSGDMVLASAQTNTGVKTFEDTTMKLRNVADTFDGYFVNTNTADRIYTLQNSAGTIAFTSDITGTNSGTNTGDQTITLTGDVTGSGTGSFAATIAADAVTMDMLVDIATDTFLGRVTASTGTVEVLTNAQAKTALDLTGTNSGDQTSIVGITGTKSQFDTAVTDGNILYVGDVTSNVSTTLSAGTITATTYGITSDGSANDIILPEATTTVAGLLGAAKWDEIVANTAKTSNAAHTGDVTGSTALTIAVDAVDIAMLSASGTANSTTYLRGDNTWSTISTGGDVSKVGTPVNNEIGIWTGDGTIEGDPNFTWDSTTSDLTLGSVSLAGDREIIIASSTTDGDLIIRPQGDGGELNIKGSMTIGDESKAFTPTITANSSATNEDLFLVPKGTGTIIVRSLYEDDIVAGSLVNKQWVDDQGFGAGSGTVTSVSAGNGLNFTTITTTGAVTMGTPSALTASTTDAVTTTSHTHSVTGFWELTGTSTLTGATTIAGAGQTLAMTNLATTEITTAVSNNLTISAGVASSGTSTLNLLGRGTGGINLVTYATGGAIALTAISGSNISFNSDAVEIRQTPAAGSSDDLLTWNSTSKEITKVAQSTFSVAAHNHSGTYEPADANLTKDNVAENITAAWDFESNVRLYDGVAMNFGTSIDAQIWWDTTDGNLVFNDAGATGGTDFVFETAGTVRFQFDMDTYVGTATDWAGTSDRRLKKNIAPYGMVLDRVKAMMGNFVTFEWKEDSRKDIGYIAQDVQPYFPEFINENKKGELSISYGKMSTVALEAIAELSKEVDELKEQIKQLIK